MRSLLRAFLIVVLVVAAAFLVLGYWTGSRVQNSRIENSPSAVGTSGNVNVERARERGAAIGEKAAVASRKVSDAMGEAALTTKIKAKMALDDSVKAAAIDVTTNGSSVTLNGTVGSEAERTRAVALARETEGVANVIDRLQIRR